jgi:tetratricopeptide (TPR) repeat protein
MTGILEAAEAAWAKFETADVGALEPVLSLADLDRRALGAAQQKAGGPPGPARERALAELAALAEKHRSPDLYDIAIAGARESAGEIEQAVLARVAALPLVPSWHPGMAARVIGNLGGSLAELGEREAARRFLERARRFDPVNPYVVATLAELDARDGRAGEARGVRRWLDDHGFPADVHATGLDALLADLPGDALEPYAPGFGELRPLDGRGFARLAANVASDQEAGPHATLRALALGAAMRGDLRVARLYADEAKTLGDQGVETDDNDAAWATAMAAWLAASGPSADRDPEVRAKALAAAVRGEPAAARSLLLDPVPALRTLAAETLADADAVALLEELAAAEVRHGVATRPPGEHGAAWALRRLRAKALGPRPLRVLPASFEPVGAAPLGEDEGLVLWLSFAHRIGPEDGAFLEATLGAASRAVEQDEPGVQVLADDDPQTVQLVLRQVKDPARVARAFVSAFSAEGSRLAEIVFGRFHLPDGAERHLLAPVAPPASRQEDADDPFTAAFDPAAAPPRSEPEGGPSFMMMPSEQGHVPEVRLPPLELADVRVVWGLPPVDDREAAPGTPAGDRETEVRAAVDAALDEAFGGQPPARRNRAGVTNGALDAIRRGGRDGFAFAVDGLGPELVAHYPGCFRFREHELLLAMAEVTRRARLAPVVIWERDGGTWIVNLWA